ncbi:MAG TPA: translocation/assembly module TamB domain-containing protein [Vicinamibacterales bacterium]|jgi:hypothetical protein
MMAFLTSLRRRWPEAALVASLLVVAAVGGVALRAAALALVGGVVAFAIRRRVRDVAVALGAAVVAIVVVAVATLTIDIGSVFGGALKTVAENQGGRYIERPLHIGRIGIHLASGRFVVEDIRIDGVKRGDAPFFTARRVLVGLPWWRVFRTREFLIASLELNDWAMQIEKFSDGDNIPRFVHESKEPKGPKRFTTTLQYVHAYRGQFTYIDHGTWRTIARNLDIYVRHDTGEYLGTATITNGVVQIKDYLPMRSDMRVKFKVDGPIIRLPEIVLDTDGAHSLVTGQVDFGHWPNMIYNVDSKVNFWRMREIFFASESWRSRGEGRFKGTFRLFKGGHELKGDFTSPLVHINVFAVPDLKGSLIWEPHRFEVTRATGRFYGGYADFKYSMAPLSDPVPAVARWDVKYRDVDLTQLSDALEMRGLRLAGTASGRNLLEWPLGDFKQHRGDGQIDVTPPAGRTVLTRAALPSESAIHDEPPLTGPEPNPTLWPRPKAIGGEFLYRFDPDWVDVAPSHLATERTYVEFQGRTAYGVKSQFPFYARSADWQESDRLLAGIISAFGSPTGVIKVGGHGEFHGTMTKAFTEPRIEGQFDSDQMRAWDVVWGRATGGLVIENGYVDITRGVVTKGASRIDADGRFSLGYPRRDQGEEINARIVAKDRDLRDLRHAFELDDWPLEGKLSGDFRLSSKYTRPFGYGRMTITGTTAWGEPFEQASASLRFEGTGVRLDAVDMKKSGGTVTGAAYVGWDGRYSFNANGQRIPMESVAAVKYGNTPLSGLMQFSMAGTSTFKSPRYEGRVRIDDVFLGDEGIGQVMGRLNVRERLLTIEQFEAASPRLAVSGSGQIEMTPTVDAELSLRFTDTSLDPYLRLFEPRLSPYTRAIASGTVRAVGQLADWDRLSVTATVETLDASLFDYALHNDGPIRLTLENNTIESARLRLAGEDTRLDVSGSVNLKERRIGVKVAGDANLGILQLFFKDMRSSGRAELSGSIDGPMTKPQFSGTAQITDGRLRLLSLPNSLQAINGRVAFAGDGIRLEDITAQLAGGRVRFGGRIEMNGYTPGQLALTATGENMELRYPEGFRSTLDAQLDLVGTMAAPTLRGTVMVKSAVYSKRIDIGPGILELAGGRTPTGSPAAAGGVAILPVRFDLRIQAPSSLRIESNLAHVVSSADLVLRGSYDRPLLFGRAEVERGEVLFEGKRYVVRRGTIDFTNPAKIEPFFDFEAETLVRVPGQTYVVNAQVVGTVNRMSEPVLTSDPPLPTVQILSLLFGGDTGRAEAKDAELRTLQREEIQGRLATSRVQQAAVGVVSAPVTKAVEQAFGLDTFQITPNVYDPYQRVTPTARLTVGKRVSSKVYFTYSRSLNTPGGGDQVILLEYDQNARMSWVFSRNEDGTYALDVRVRHVF